MGKWGRGSFENDAALDFAASIETVEDLAAALALRTPQDRVDADLACRARSGERQEGQAAQEEAGVQLLALHVLRPADGRGEVSQLTIALDINGLPMGRGGFCHHECLNAALHPAHMIRDYQVDQSIRPDELDALLDQPPSAI